MSESNRDAGPLRRLLDELRRRRVPRTLLAYLVGSWVVLQVADVVVPALGLPAWTLTLLVVLVLAGLPVAAALSWSYDLTRRGVLRDEETGGRGAGRWGVAALVGLVALAAGAAAWYGWARLGPTPAALDPDRVAVLPFRVGGADPGVAYLREGMVDLLTARLGTPGSPTAVDPRAVLESHEDRTAGGAGPTAVEAALEVAADVGAGLVVTGEVVGPPSNLSIRALLRSVPEGATIASATVAGPEDSLPALVERLAVSLLSLRAGEREDRLPALVASSPPALRAYLEGRAAFRRGAYAEAADHLTRAVDLDSTFALAGYALFRTSGWTVADGARGFRIAWDHRHRLPRPDRLVVEAQAGPAYPAPSSVRDRIDAWSAAVAEARGRPEPLMALADLYFHYGSQIGIEGWRERAASYFEAALRADPRESAALSHLTHLALADADTARAARLLHRFARLDPESATRLYLEWFLSVRRGDGAVADSIVRRLPELDVGPLMYIVGTTISEGLALDQGDSIVPHLLDAATTPQQQAFVLEEVYYFESNRGRPGAAQDRLADLRALDPDLADRLAVIGGLLGDGDASAASEAAGRIRRRLDAAGAGPAVADRCVLSQWQAFGDETREAAAELERLRRLAGGSVSPTDSAHAASCAILLDAVLAARGSGPNARARVLRADSMIRTGPPLPPGLAGTAANLAVSRLLQVVGERDAALAAAARRPYWAPRANFLRAASLEREGDLAAAAGRRDQARRAYGDYLTLRSAPEPSLDPAVQRVRDALRRLRGAG